MTDIPIFDKNGNKINSIHIPETVEYVNGRVSKGEKFYYKGIGIPYQVHHIYPDDMSDEYDFIGYSSVFYLGNIVSKKSYQKKFGIFQEKHQPHFTDWIGSCGVKELNMFENLYDEGGFEFNAVEALEYQTIDETNQQYYLKVNYPEGRNTYTSNPNSQNLRKLIDYMIQTDWNFPWDKNSISDISHMSKVTDVADLFKSSELSHKIGTVYSVLYSLFNENKKEYYNFCNANNMTHQNSMSFIFNSLYILSSNGVDILSLYKKNPLETYKNIVLNYLVVGKNCGFCGVGSCKGRKDSNQSYGEEIKEEYIRRAMLDLSL